MRVEHEYARDGAWAYLAALDVHRAKVFGRCEATTGIAPFERLVDQVMSQPPYVSGCGDDGGVLIGRILCRMCQQRNPTMRDF